MKNHIDLELLNLLPGGDLVKQGMFDLEEGKITRYSLLLAMAGPRLRSIGFNIPELQIERPYNHRLYEYLVEQGMQDPYSTYCADLRRIASFSACMEAREF